MIFETLLAAALEARAIIADPDRWCTGTEAMDATGRAVGIGADKAVRWCAVGAASKGVALVGADNRRGGFHAAEILREDLHKVSLERHKVPVTMLNDGTAAGHSKPNRLCVLEVYDQVIAIYRAEVEAHELANELEDVAL